MKRGPRPKRRPVIIVACSVIRLGRRVRATCGPIVSKLTRVVVRVVASDADGSTLTAHVVIAAVSSAAFSVGAGWAGFGGSELCQLVGAMVVGALAVSAASLLIRRRLGAGELRPLLASTTQLVWPAHAGLPAARVLQLAFDPPRTLAALSAGVTRAALALPVQHGQAALLRLVSSSMPVLALALDAHTTYRDMQQGARFVRHFALTAAALCPEPDEAYALPLDLYSLLPAAAELPAQCA
jgi:hypothetical protein